MKNTILLMMIWVSVVSYSFECSGSEQIVKLRLLELLHSKDTTLLDECFSDLSYYYCREKLDYKPSSIVGIDITTSRFDPEDDQFYIYVRYPSGIPSLPKKHIMGYFPYKGTNFIVMGSNAKLYFKKSKHKQYFSVPILKLRNNYPTSDDNSLIRRFITVKSRPHFIYIPFLVTTDEVEYATFMRYLCNEIKSIWPNFDPYRELATLRMTTDPIDGKKFILLGATSHQPWGDNSLILDNNRDILGYIKYGDMRFLVFGDESKKYFKVFPYKRYIKVRLIEDEERLSVFDGGIFWRIKIALDVNKE